MQDRGFGTPSGNYFAMGTVVKADGGADPHGVLADLESGDRISWRGRTVDVAGSHFVGPFWIFS